jgi:hypothetical protein
MAEAAKLIEQGLRTTVLGAENVGTHFSDVAIVGCDDLLLVDNGPADYGVSGCAHYPLSVALASLMEQPHQE